MEDSKFRESYEKSPIGIIFFDKEGKLTNANQSTLKIMGYPLLNDVIGLNIFNDPYIAPKKKELLKKGHIKIQSPYNFDKIKKSGFYNPTRSGIAFLDLTISVIDSGFLGQIQDITENKMANEKLLQKHNILEAVIEGSEGPIFSVDRNYRYTSFNLQHARIMKNLFDVDIEIGGNILDYHTNPDDRQNAKLNIDRVLNGEIVEIGSYVGDTPQNRRYFSIFHTPIKDSNGKVTGAAVYAHDWTERKKAEEELLLANKSLRQSREDMDRAQEVGQIGSWRLDVRRNALTWSDENYRIFGVPKGTPMTYEMFLEIVHPDDRQYVDTQWKAGLTGEPYDIEHRIMVGEQVKWVREKAYLEFDDAGVLGGFGITQDITELKNSEEALRESEEKFKSLYSSIIEGVAIHEVLYDSSSNAIDYTINDVNPAYESITGLKRSEIIGKKASEVYGTEEPPYIDIYSKVAETGKPAYFDTYFEPMDKHFSIAVTSPYKGKFATFFEDITERKKAEEALKQTLNNLEEQVKERTVELELANAYNRSLIEASLDPLVTIGPDGKINDVNKSTETVTGFTRDELIGTDFLNYFTEPQKAKSGYQQVFRDGEVRDYPLEIKHKNGSIKPVLYNATVYRDESGEVIGVFAAARDITEQKKAEEELKTERDNLNTILNTTKSGVYIVNNDYELVYVNPRIEEDFGLLKGQKCHEYFYDKEDICSDCILQKAFQGNIVEWKQFSSKSNKTYDALATPITEPEGLYSVLVFLYDATRRDEAEKQLKEIISELERSNKELQSFAYITSHDLQEPLRTIGNYAGLLKRRYEGELDEDADDFLDYMASGAARMKDMVQGLLDYSRVGTQGGEFREFNAEEALDNALANLRSAVEECHTEITFDSLPVINADEGQITRVFQNLIGNALKFHRESVKPEIHISAHQGGDEYIFSVSDNGIGIEEEYTEHIFEVFKRLHAIGEYNGVGIGLAVVKRIIERHGGRVWVESEFGKGSTFYFTIPIVNEV